VIEDIEAIKKACEVLIKERDVLALKVEVQEQALRDLLQVRLEEWGVGGIIG